MLQLEVRLSLHGARDCLRGIGVDMNGSRETSS